jgi:hypothetical protein
MPLCSGDVLGPKRCWRDSAHNCTGLHLMGTTVVIGAGHAAEIPRFLVDALADIAKCPALPFALGLAERTIGFRES